MPGANLQGIASGGAIEFVLAGSAVRTINGKVYAHSDSQLTVVGQFELGKGWRGISRFGVAPETGRRKALRPATQHLKN